MIGSLVKQLSHAGDDHGDLIVIGLWRLGFLYWAGLFEMSSCAILKHPISSGELPCSWVGWECSSAGMCFLM